jgi:hypothetical protein
MKKIPFFFLILSFPLLGQSINSSKILDLNYNAANSFKNSSLKSESFSSYQEQNKKSPGLAIIYSLLIPGMGELYAGSYSSGKYFTIAEGVLWATYAGFNAYGNWQKDNYKSFAASSGGVINVNKNDDYYANVGLYLSITDYNNAQALNGNFSAMYDQKTFYWNWTDVNRKTYRGMWLSSQNAFNDLRFIVGAMILNRVISAINAVRLVAKYNKNLEQNVGWNISVGVINRRNITSGLNLNFQTQF